MNQRKKIFFSLSLVGMIGLGIVMKQSTESIKAAEEESGIEWLDTTEAPVILPEESVDIVLEEETINDSTMVSSEDVLNHLPESSVEASPRAIVTSAWGTAPVSFDTTTGTLTVSSGTLAARPTSDFLDSNDKIAKIDVKKIILNNGVVAPSNSGYLFAGSTNFASGDKMIGFDNLVTISGNLNTMNVTTMSRMVSNTSSLTSLDTSKWNTSKVIDMSYVFASATSLSVIDVSNWDTSSVTSMESTFANTRTSNLDVSKWNTSKVTNMQGTFYNAKGITSVDVSKWNTSKVTTMSGVFRGAANLTNVDISKWDTSNVKKMTRMFNDTKNLTLVDVSEWDTSKVTEMDSMFQNASNLTNLDVRSWNTSKVTSMSNMFTGTTKLNTLTLGSNSIFNSTVNLPDVNKAGGVYTGGWDRVVPEKPASVYTSSADFMLNYDGSMPGTYEWETVVIDSSWGTSPVLFDRTTGILTVSSGTLEAKPNSVFLDTKDKINKTAVKEIILQDNVFSPEKSNYLFSGFVAGGGAQFTNLVRISGLLDTKATTNMESMFRGTSSLLSLDVSEWDISNVTVLTGIFWGASNLTSVNVSDWDTSNVTIMGSVFRDMSSLVEVDVGKWDTSKVTNMYMLFSNTNLTTLDLSNWNTIKVTNMSNMFAGNTSLNTLILGSNSIFNSTVKLPAIDSTLEEYTGGWERTIPVLPAVSYESSTVFMTDYDGSNPGTYTWQTAGDLSIMVPAVMAFKETNVPVSKQTKSLREDSDWAIKVTDQRANSLRNQWQLTARLAEPFTNKKDQTLDSVLKFKAAADKPVYTLDAVNSVPIYQSTISPDKVTDQAIGWSADAGFYLDFDAFGFYPTGDYTSIIEFSVESVPTS
ncbi:BspA family leucine-rich repeat surface protein [Enterococcus sp. 5H]|uniref:BspA family leucine-rich repeat surface protein n=1 Tax=Enterococcus sp. 5H TaxID=1229490 RepID=UPI002302BCCA|nr:BspA family leucine-rich repeat surface protein [Enterococcus sp. 5H]MDA9472577.1 hypothetical protein [Enterococcus sp. 5H]